MEIRQRSISLPIVLASISVALSIALLVGWTLLLARYIDLTREVGAGVSYMVLGIISFVSIMVIMILVAVFLVREILNNRKQVRFIDSVTHELKSPLASMQLSAETLATRDIDEEQRRKLQGMILNDIDRLSMFIDDILKAGRLEMRAEPVERQRIELRELLEEHANPILRRYELDEEREFSLDIPDDIVIFTDRGILLTIFNNLLDNACKYSSSPRDVRVSARESGEDDIVLEVADNGIGISSSELHRVKRRFYRVANEDTHSRHGSGLGLYVVDGYARRIGASLSIDSPGRGEGTTVRVTLPIGERTRNDEASDNQEADATSTPDDRSHTTTTGPAPYD